MDETICIFEDAIDDDSARARAEAEKATAFGVLARMKLWDRPKEAEITLTRSEKRYEPFWMARAVRRTVYTRHARYGIRIEHPDVVAVEVLGQRLATEGRRELQLDAVEDCEGATRLVHYVDGLHKDVPEKALADYASRFPFHELADSNQPHYIVPVVTAASVLQQVKSRLATPVEAYTIASDELDITSITLFYRPVHAFQFNWRDKTGVLEMDGLTGQVNRDGNLFGGALRKLGNRDALFDLGADFAGMVLPGGTIVVKLIDKLSRKHSA